MLSVELNYAHTLLFTVSSRTYWRSTQCYHLGWWPGGGSGSHRSLLWLQLQRQPVLRHFSSGTFLWHHKFLHFLWPALGGYKGHTWSVIVCLVRSSVSLLLLLVTSSGARLSECLKIHRSLRTGWLTNKNSSLFDEWYSKEGSLWSVGFLGAFYSIFVGHLGQWGEPAWHPC